METLYAQQIQAEKQLKDIQEQLESLASSMKKN